MICLTLPFPPTINHMYGQRGSRKYMKKDGVEFKKQVADIVSDAAVQTLKRPVAVFVTAHMPDNRRRDLMNLEKILSDSLTSSGVWDDDSQIHDFHIVKSWNVKGGMVKVVITEIEGAK